MFPAVLISLIVVLLTCVHLYKVVRDRRYAHLGGPKGLPLVGSLFEFGSNSLDIKRDLERVAKTYGRLFRIWLGPFQTYVIVTEPKDVQAVYASTKILHKAADYDYLRRWVNDGILVSTGEKWKNRRKQIIPAYHITILEKMIDCFNSQSDIFVNKISKYLNGDSFNVYPLTSLCSLDIMTEASLGIQMNAQIVENCSFSAAVEQATYIMHLRSFSLWKRSDFLFGLSSDSSALDKCIHVVHGRIREIIAERKQELRDSIREAKTEKENEFGQKHRYALLDLLLRLQYDGEQWTDDDIKEEIQTLMFAAQDTVSTCMSYSIYSLATNPHVQEKAMEEIREVMGDDKSLPATFQQLMSLKYLERVIKETLRKYPSIPITGREVYEDFDLNGKIIPAGTSVITPLFIMQMDPEIFPDPHKFDPDRFLDGWTKDQSSTYMPFSTGPRACLGQKFAMLEIKAFLSNVLRNYLIIPGNDIEPISDVSIVMRPVNGIHIILKERVY